MTITLYTQPGCGGCIFAAKDLTKAGVPDDFRPSKNNTTRKDAVEAIRQAYDKNPMTGHGPSRDDFEALLWHLLAIADRNALERQKSA